MLIRYYTRKEAAEKLRVIPETISVWIREGKLPATRVGNKWLIPASAIENRVVVEGASA